MGAVSQAVKSRSLTYNFLLAGWLATMVVVEGVGGGELRNYSLRTVVSRAAARTSMLSMFNAVQYVSVCVQYVRYFQ